ncbi:DNA repair protein RecN [Enemella evansiae]|uniref:DNA repair protein RecN n=1 Tax=Enemella evansiae TaxID=2016499 RepID=UPI000B95F564|nr:DNA repair protein RecN [Enemella evansiae]OYO05641.1 DNA repair protein RecN [Enemella evansiae]
MIGELRIADLGVIDDAVIELAPGLSVVTGETGAGKTMVVTGLGLLLGQRADSGAIRRGARSARVEGVFSRLPEGLADQVTEAGGELDDGELLLARQLGGSRSRGFVGGAGVPVAQQQEIAEQLVTIHGQSEQVRLAAPARQREILDRAAGPKLAKALASYRADHTAREAAAAELADLRDHARERAREADLLQFGLDEIEKVDPQPGEDTALAAEAERLQAVDDLRLAAHTAVVALAGDEDSIDQGSALTAAATARKALEGAAAQDPELAGLADRSGEVMVLAAELAQDLSGYLAGLEADPNRLEWIAERRAALQGLTRKYGETVDEVLAWSADAAGRLGGLAASDDRIEALAAEVAALDERLATRAAELTALRRKAAERLSAAVLTELAALAMPHARLEFAITPLDRLGPHGADQVVLQFTANPGSDPRPLARVASGGELSRVRLALEVVLADAAERTTLVFDEVDAGVGGRVAVEIGRRLARLAEHHQVLVVTHLAQVAAFADRHLVVQKSSDGQVTTSGVRQLDGAEREAELARMMAGIDTSDSSLAHARELLTEAGQARPVKKKRSRSARDADEIGDPR